MYLFSKTLTTERKRCSSYSFWWLTKMKKKKSLHICEIWTDVHYIRSLYIVPLLLNVCALDSSGTAGPDTSYKPSHVSFGLISWFCFGSDFALRIELYIRRLFFYLKMFPLLCVSELNIKQRRSLTRPPLCCCTHHTPTLPRSPGTFPLLC